MLRIIRNLKKGTVQKPLFDDEDPNPSPARKNMLLRTLSMSLRWLDAADIHTCEQHSKQGKIKAKNVLRTIAKSLKILKHLRRIPPF